MSKIYIVQYDDNESYTRAFTELKLAARYVENIISSFDFKARTNKNFDYSVDSIYLESYKKELNKKTLLFSIDYPSLTIMKSKLDYIYLKN